MKVIKIGAVWCSGCLVMAPRWKEIEKENPWLKTEYYDFDQTPDIVEKYNLEEGTIPTFIFLDKNGDEIHRSSGELSKKALIELISKFRDA